MASVVGGALGIRQPRTRACASRCEHEMPTRNNPAHRGVVPRGACPLCLFDFGPQQHLSRAPRRAAERDAYFGDELSNENYGFRFHSRSYGCVRGGREPSRQVGIVFV